MSAPTPEQVQALADAVWQVLDDMGSKGHGVCSATKALVRVAYEPFLDQDSHGMDDWLSLEKAKEILKEVGLI